LLTKDVHCLHNDVVILLFHFLLVLVMMLLQIQNYESTFGNLHQERWTIDEPEDYLFIKNIFEHFKSNGKEYFDTKDILTYLNKNPEIRNINKGFIRNEGLLISLRNDRIVKSPDEE